MMQKIFVISAFLLGVPGKSPLSDVGVERGSVEDSLGSVGDNADDRAGSKKIPNIDKMNAKTVDDKGFPNLREKWKGPPDMKMPEELMERMKRRPEDLTEEERERIREKRAKRKSRPAGPPVAHIFDIKDGEGNIKHLDSEHFPNAKIFMILNIATGCDEMSQLPGLEKVYRDFKPRGLEIIAFPTNSFNEEPLEDEEIQLLIKEQYDITFPVMSKIDVNGDSTSPLYAFLKSHGIGPPPQKPKWTTPGSELKQTDIQWNFEKFLVYEARGRERVMRFPYDMEPQEVGMHVERSMMMMSYKKIEL